MIAQLNLICKNTAHNCSVLALDLDPSGFDGHIGSESVIGLVRGQDSRCWQALELHWRRVLYSKERAILKRDIDIHFGDVTLARGLQLQTMHREICSLRSSVKQILLVVVLYYYDYKI